MKPNNHMELWRFAWHLLFAGLLLAAMAAAIAVIIFQNSYFLLPAAALLTIALLVGFFAILLLTYENVRSIKNSSEKLDSIIEMTNRNRNMFAQIAHGVLLSDAAKTIAFRDNDRMQLAEAVLAKLYQHDFNATAEMIDAIAQRTEYADLARQLTQTAQKFKDATEEGKINQIISHITKLAEQYHWAQATAATDRLLKAFPESEKAQQMSQKLRELKDKRKAKLLAEWDEAVKKKDTDYSLEILKELDQYLTPTEALALQESASSVFRTKLHNLGVQFSVEITEKKWSKAVETGRQIISDLPNSRMAREIHSKMEILKENAGQKNTLNA